MLLALCVLSVSETTIAEVGEYRPANLNIPSSIRDAAKGVVQIAVLNSKPVEIVDFEQFSRMHNNQKPENVIGEQNQNPKLKNLYLEQLKNCRQKFNFKKCGLFAPLRLSAGFFLGDGQSLWTDAHLIEPIAAATAAQALEVQNLAIAVFDVDDNLLFMSGLEDKSAHLDIVPSRFPGRPSLTMPNPALRTSSDLARIHLSKSVGKPLALAKVLPPENSALYAVGFPSGPGATDSLGAAQSVSVGVLLNTLEGVNRIRRHESGHEVTELEWSHLPKFEPFNLRPDNYAVDLTQVLMSEFDADYGKGGWPLLNESGEVIAIAQIIVADKVYAHFLRRTTVMSTNLIEIQRKLNYCKGLSQPIHCLVL